MTNTAFSDHRAAALALLNGNNRLTRKAGQFLGQCAVEPSRLSEPQAAWIAKLLINAGLPPLSEVGPQ